MLVFLSIRYLQSLVPEAAEVVKLIFELTAQGKSKTEVANYLNAQGIDTPSAYKKRKGSRNFFHVVEVKSLWSTSSIRDILNDEVYLGKLIWHTLIQKNVFV